MIYRKTMVVLKEETMEKVEGDGHGVAHEQQEEYLLLGEQRNCGHRGNDKEWRKDADGSLKFSSGQERRLGIEEDGEIEWLWKGMEEAVE